MINQEIKDYIEKYILPVYDNFDGAHKTDHANKVIENSLEIAEEYDVKLEMVYVIAAYHDIGLINGRENHHSDSGKMILADKNLSKWFTDDEVIIMSEAVVDHRASNDYEPRSIFGKIVAEADRDINYYTVIKRTTDYSYSKYLEYSIEQHVERIIKHIQEKYGENGYLHLWLNTKRNQSELEIIRERLKDKEAIIADIKSYIGGIK